MLHTNATTSVSYNCAKRNGNKRKLFNPLMQKQIYRFSVAESGVLIDVLADHLPFSKTRIKKLLGIGCVWIRHRNSRRLRRIRRIKAPVHKGDFIAVYYDPHLERLQTSAPELLADHQSFSVWYKPAGVLTQGTKFGDYATVLRYVEQRLHRPALLVHRLDRETAGILLIAHTRSRAAFLSALFREHRIQKVYRAEVAGNLTEHLPSSGYLDTPLDGKPACTFYTVDHYCADRNASLVTLTPQTGRFHQIRRHFAGIGHPIIGDRKYGGPPSPTGWLHLAAIHLSFQDGDTVYRFTLPEEKIQWRLQRQP